MGEFYWSPTKSGIVPELPPGNLSPASRGLPGVVLRCDSWTSPEDVHTAAQAARRAVAEWFAAHGEPPEVVAEVFRVTRKDNCWLADRCVDWQQAGF